MVKMTVLFGFLISTFSVNSQASTNQINPCSFDATILQLSLNETTERLLSCAEQINDQAQTESVPASEKKQWAVDSLNEIFLNIREIHEMVQKQDPLVKYSIANLGVIIAFADYNITICGFSDELLIDYAGLKVLRDYSAEKAK